MVFLEVVIMIVGVGTELQFLHLDNVLLPLGFVLLLFVLVLPLAEIHRLGDWRIGGGGNQNQVKAHVLRFSHGGERRHDLDWFVREYRANFANAKRLIYVFPNFWATGRIVSRRDH